MNVFVFIEDAGTDAVPYLNSTTSDGILIIQSDSNVSYQVLLRLIIVEQNHKGQFNCFP